MINPVAVDINASLIPPVTCSELTPELPSFKNEKEFIKPITVPSNPISGEIVIIVENKLLNLSNSGCID